MTQAQLEALLGRPLSSIEVTNLTLYLDIANERLQKILCYSVVQDVGAQRFFTAREGYSTVFVGAIQTITEVKLNGVITTDFTPYLWDSRNSDWFNSIVFKETLEANDEVQITGTWGFSSMPGDLSQLLAKVFDLVSSGISSDTNVSSKKVEDFSISFDTNLTAEQRLIDSNIATINKYSLCNIGQVRNGLVC